jgi:hypothetical protein
MTRWAAPGRIAGARLGLSAANAVLNSVLVAKTTSARVRIATEKTRGLKK